MGEAWMDGEKGRNRKRKEEREGWECSNLGGEPHCRADQSWEFCLWANLLFWSGVMAVTPLFPSVCWSVHRVDANSPIDSDWATLINFFLEIMVSSVESARHEKTRRKTFPYVSRTAKAAPLVGRNLFLFIVKTLSEKWDLNMSSELFIVWGIREQMWVLGLSVLRW